MAHQSVNGSSGVRGVEDRVMNGSPTVYGEQSSRGYNAHGETRTDAGRTHSEYDSSPKLTFESAPASSAWFVPEPDDEPPTEPTSLHAVAPVVLEVEHNATLPTNHILGVRPHNSSSSSASSAWGSAASETDPNQASLNLESAISTPSGRTRAGSNWSSASPHDLVSSPRGHFSPGEFDPVSSPRMSAHRVQNAMSGNAANGTFQSSRSNEALSSASPSAASRFADLRAMPATGSIPSTGLISPPTAVAPAIPVPNAKMTVGRDSCEMTDASSSHVSGPLSYTSRATTVTEEPSDDEEATYSGDEDSKGNLDPRFAAAQRAAPVAIGSVPGTSTMSMVSPRSSGSGSDFGSNQSGSLKNSSERPGPPASTGSAPRHGTMRPPRTKSVTLNPMHVINRPLNQSGNSVSSSPGSAPFSTATHSGPNTPTSPPGSGSHSQLVNPLSPRGLNDSLDARRSSSTQTLQSLQAIPAPIAAALNIASEAPAEMKTGGDTHILQWAWDLRKKHPFLKISTDHSSLSWSSSSNYGLARSNAPLTRRKTFIELAKTRGVSQLLQIGLAKTVEWSSSPEKMQFNSVKIPGEWSAIWVKTSATGDRFGVLYDLDAHKLTVYRNGVIAYSQDLPTSFNVEEAPEASADGAESSSTPSPPPSTVSEAEALYPFVGVCGDQDLLITEMPEFEKYVDIVWAHQRKTQHWAPSETPEGIPAILEVLGLQKLRPKFEGMSLAAFQKLKDADLRKIGASTEQRRRLLSQIETMK